MAGYRGSKELIPLLSTLSGAVSLFNVSIPGAAAYVALPLLAAFSIDTGVAGAAYIIVSSRRRPPPRPGNGVWAGKAAFAVTPS